MSSEAEQNAIEMRVAEIEDSLRELASEAEGAADILSGIAVIEEKNGEEVEVLSEQKVRDVIVNLDYAAGFPGENPLREIVDRLEEVASEIEELYEAEEVS